MHLMSGFECRSSRRFVSHPVKEQKHFAAALALMTCGGNIYIYIFCMFFLHLSLDRRQV